MTFFADQPVSAPAPRPRRRAPRSVVVGWVLLVLGVVGTLVVGMTPAPYVIERPGPVFDTLGSQKVDGKATPLISIDGAKTYETSGQLDLLTVNILGSREQRLNWVDIALAWFDPAEAVVPLESIYPEGVSDKQVDEQSAVEMQNSQQEAIAAALRSLDYDVRGSVKVAGVEKGSPADGKLKADDVVVSADGTAVGDLDALRELISKHADGTPVSLVVRRSGVERTIDVVPAVAKAADGSDTVAVGVYTSIDYAFPIDVELKLDKVGGPSAGMMFALGIVDKLTPGEMTGGEHIAGTGTIDAAGEVGAIGGIRQKMYGAQRAGATFFLAPKSNCDEVVGHVPSGLTVYSVGTLKQAETAVEAIASGKGRAALPTCGG
ncbi:PDZ domain-containing protein [Schumannella luteola]|uniref:endopeptidase La n=1 Tax=Schumannella luteola TaxID=472059 RepID=A0A852YDY6_9MICO|nr:PDZ domain-containing protein [Schumannella luteola]NYG99520.1 PDZ domain-containing protein [Schumannella luteola]TPX03842.1 PDZ domain-containing protein [Schumannella luteola]